MGEELGGIVVTTEVLDVVGMEVVRETALEEVDDELLLGVAELELVTLVEDEVVEVVLIGATKASPWKK